MKVIYKNSSIKYALSIEALLLQQHKMLLVKQVTAHVTGRLLSFGLLVYLALSGGSTSTPSRVTLLILCFAATVISFFWLYLAKATQDDVGRLEEVIVQGNDINRGSTKHASLSMKSNEVEDSEEVGQGVQIYEDKESGDVDRWIQIYIEWQHERWKHAGRERVIKLEPLVWWGLIIVFAVFQFTGFRL